MDKDSDPAPIYKAATAFWESAALFAACRLGVFDALGEPTGAAELAKRLGLSERGAETLLDSCVSLALLEKTDGVYRNTASAERYLTSRSPESLLVTLDLQADTYPMWVDLPEAVTKGQPAIPPHDLLGRDRELTRKFVVGMHQRAVGIAAALVDVVDLTGHRLLVDIGGGPGAYSRFLLKRYPDLRSRVLDLPPILEVARTLVTDSGVRDRIEMVPCDVTTDAIGDGFDVALVSGLLHRMTPGTCRSILRRIHAGMVPGGQVILNDLFTIDGRPEMAVLFGLQMLLTNETGGAHDARDVASWLSGIGFVDVTITPLPPHIAIVARKAGDATMHQTEG
jgi:cyclopropane fatty-acyl-phospholipid synthase-like methyltransferase